MANSGGASASALTEGHLFTFNHVFRPPTKQKDVYEDVARPIVADVMAGYNGTVFVYGQTGSGKTHTMFGQQQARRQLGQRRRRRTGAGSQDKSSSGGKGSKTASSGSRATKYKALPGAAAAPAGLMVQLDDESDKSSDENETDEYDANDEEQEEEDDDEEEGSEDDDFGSECDLHDDGTDDASSPFDTGRGTTTRASGALGRPSRGGARSSQKSATGAASSARSLSNSEQLRVQATNADKVMADGHPVPAQAAKPATTTKKASVADALVTRNDKGRRTVHSRGGAGEGDGRKDSGELTTSLQSTDSVGAQGSSSSVTVAGHVSSKNEEEAEKAAQQGIVPRAVHDIFNSIARAESCVEFEVRLSLIEVYMEQARDLLGTGSNSRSDHRLQVREDVATQSFYVEDCELPYVTSPAEALQLIRQGLHRRATFATAMNAHSSRSHCVLCISVKSVNRKLQESRMGKLFLVDLAGSEKVFKTKADGMRLEEAKLINKSLTTLGQVIVALTERASHVPYRDSVLTKVLKDSLGGNTKTALIVCCSPLPQHAQETLSTLRFGARAKNIENRAVVNRQLTVEELTTMLALAKEEIKRLQALHARDDGSAQSPPPSSKTPPPRTLFDTHTPPPLPPQTASFVFGAAGQSPGGASTSSPPLARRRLQLGENGADDPNAADAGGTVPLMRSAERSLDERAREQLRYNDVLSEVGSLSDALRTAQETLTTLKEQRDAQQRQIISLQEEILLWQGVYTEQRQRFAERDRREEALKAVINVYQREVHSLREQMESLVEPLRIAREATEENLTAVFGPGTSSQRRRTLIALESAVQTPLLYRSMSRMGNTGTGVGTGTDCLHAASTSAADGRQLTRSPSHRNVSTTSPDERNGRGLFPTPSPPPSQPIPVTAKPPIPLSPSALNASTHSTHLSQGPLHADPNAHEEVVGGEETGIDEQVPLVVPSTQAEQLIAAIQHQLCQQAQTHREHEEDGDAAVAESRPTQRPRRAGEEGGDGVRNAALCLSSSDVPITVPELMDSPPPNVFSLPATGEEEAMLINTVLSEAAAQRVVELEEQVSSMENAFSQLRRDHSSTLSQLQMIEKTLRFRQNRIEVLQMGVRQERSANQELRQLLEGERDARHKLLQAARSDASYWRRRYEELARAQSSGSVGRSGYTPRTAGKEDVACTAPQRPPAAMSHLVKGIKGGEASWKE